MTKYFPAALGIGAMLLASTASATAARSAMESASVKAATDCVAAAALNNSDIITLYQENRLREVTNWVVLRSSACNNPLNAMRLLHDQIYGPGTGQMFVHGDYLQDLPRAVGERIKVEVLRRMVQKSNQIRDANAAPVGVPPTPTPSTATRLDLNIIGNTVAVPPSLSPPSVGGIMLPVPPAPLLISRGTELKVVQVSAFGTLNMREKPTNESRVVEFIPPNGEGIISLGETHGQWVFVQYDRAKGWVERQFVMPILSDGGRM